jgi:hypothetical protein
MKKRREEQKICGIGDGIEKFKTRTSSSDGNDCFINRNTLWSIIEKPPEGVKM